MEARVRSTVVSAATVVMSDLSGVPEDLRRHLTCRVVNSLEPIVQGHTIEGLVMGGTES
jgi:hypothetical protein